MSENTQQAEGAAIEEEAPQMKAFTCAHLKIKEVPVPESKDGKPSLRFTKTFHVEYTNPDTGNLHTGEFGCRRLNAMLMIQYSVVKARLCEGLTVNPGGDMLASWLAYLEVALNKWPDWWKQYETYDQEALHALHDYVRVWEESFRKGRVG